MPLPRRGKQPMTAKLIRDTDGKIIGSLTNNKLRILLNKVDAIRILDRKYKKDITITKMGQRWEIR